MDIAKALRELYTEKKRLDAAIAVLEARLSAPHSRSAAKTGARRGRKSMSAAERKEVSRRMTLYWEARRAQLKPTPLPSRDDSHASTTASGAVSS
jgi:hypothetical protein